MVEQKKQQIIAFTDPIDTTFKQKRTGKDFLLSSVDPTKQYKQKDLERIADICNEEVIYSRLFWYRLDDKPYETKHAEDFIAMSLNRWQNRDGFCFLLLDEDREVSGLIEIKSPYSSSMIGYWNTVENPGVMSNALIALCPLASRQGFKELYAIPNPDNIASKKVLTNAGFHKSELAPSWNGEMWPKYVKSL